MGNALGHCAVCSFDIAGEVTNCPKCEAPHCKDCWKYNGSKCAIYGCDNTVVKPELLASPVPPPQIEVLIIERRSSATEVPEVFYSRPRPTPAIQNFWSSSQFIFVLTRSVLFVVILGILFFPSLCKLAIPDVEGFIEVFLGIITFCLICFFFTVSDIRI
jgi:hypothetical protein